MTVVCVLKAYETKISALQCKIHVHGLGNAGAEFIPCRGIPL